MKNGGTDTETAPRSAADELEVLADSLEAVFQGLAFAVSLPFVYWGLWTKAMAIPPTEAVEVSCPYCRCTEVMEIPDTSAQFGSKVLYTCRNSRCLEEFRA